MTRRWTSAGPCALGALLLALAGCSTNNVSRGSADDESERDRYGVRTVGDVTAVGNADPVPLGGVGLVVGLEGTGGDCAPDGYRAMLADQLRKEGVQNVKEVLSHPNHALVVVEAALPPGTAKGDPLDVEVKLPAGSRATSLRGGYLKKCVLFNYDFTRNLSPEYSGGQSLVKGHAVAHAEGPVLVGVGTGDGDDAVRLKQGRIWAGGRARADQPLALMMNTDQQFARVSALVGERVNETFQGGLRPADAKLASAKNNLAVALRVPAQYRLNLPRFLRVVRLIPLGGDGDAPAAAGKRPYRQQLAADLLDPAQAVTAALRLEALGPKSVPALRAGLESKNALVRFCAAEALAYLGSPGGGEELAKAVAEEPLFRAFALTALASLDEAVCREKLQELLTTAHDDETRYGAFRALRALDEHHPAVGGQLLNDSFWLHRVAPYAPPLVHVSSTRRAEVVLFGEEPRLKPPFSLLAGEFAVTAPADDTRCTVSRFPLGGAPSRKQCSLKLDDVLRTMAELGGLYPEAVALLQQAHGAGGLSCRVRCDALPQAVSVYELAKMGKEASGQAGGARELLPAGPDLGATPTLYDLGLPSRSPLR